MTSDVEVTAKYFVDASGKYLGGFVGAAPPAGAIEVPTAPVDARQVWSNGAWSAIPAPTTVLKSTVMARVIAANKMGQAQTALWANPNQFARWFAPDQPLVNCNDPDTVAFITALGLDPTVTLAPQ